jgi:uncharacterized SAM-binding protein YcdF (DUF218 family)
MPANRRHERMNYLLKRILGDLVQPLPLVFLLLLAGLGLAMARKRRSGGALFALAAGLLLALSYGWLCDAGLRSLEYRYPPLADAGPHRGVKWVVVLGGGLVSDPRLPVTGQLTEGSQLRLVEGIRLYRQLKGARLLVSGGPVLNDVPESQAMAQLAVQALEVPAGDIAQDSASLDTEAQAAAVKRLVGGDSLVLVTSAYHMPRSMALFGRMGMRCLAGPTHFLTRDQQGFNPDRLFPNSGAIRRAEALFHEYVGMAWSRLRNKI